ncbi:hypothetical protein [Sulfitobacter geojensis]|uniref:Uncharacterized protein n=4 Tax=Sulfitobacter geojensis TaxID=1342299 RepID=A0AAE2W267_9RHOB|nr:hypothetical protein [Sulfitobacter geojensis]MBM1691592.1 hypothetical protein [Sulfitobacter geojensis]MBM1695647.1 hypothetical protein [Sulfitobacter geojensis]MBM1707813.1 hypothetical protein [Sulfitobacter geojensis]MBM1711888.1 hypothetical protein [Sulfitobacter geojensis]MBM1715955.1 hypothetical protein [Sulfitobacter geojensis]
MSRPDPKDIFTQKPSIFSWMRDRAYDFVYYEIGTGLDFVGDLFRGPSGYSQSLHRQAARAQTRTPKAKPLTKAEQAIFAFMLRRKSDEGQIAYWKRKKALLSVPDKQSLVQQHQDRAAKMAKDRSPRPQIVVDNVSPTQGLKRSKKPKNTKPRTPR